METLTHVDWRWTEIPIPTRFRISRASIKLVISWKTGKPRYDNYDTARQKGHPLA